MAARKAWVGANLRHLRAAFLPQNWHLIHFTPVALIFILNYSFIYGSEDKDD
jgi:hypothetical protein